ncbi:MAG TPA: LacI family DNA-binding transcriptional regulator [Candidatus Limnocylindrales bacterium]|jgi:LacI family transcriptional regulator|nr:LacI family DNA-binding transcriptional regulator [Candidatus Limnocylindrales bacterium]
MPASLADVARLAGVSIATASRALNGSQHPVSPRARERVLQAAAEVGYSPSPLAQALVNRRSPVIGVIVGDVVDPFFAEVTRGVEDVAREARFMTIICDSDRRTGAEIDYIRLLRDYHAAGVVFAGGGFRDDPRAGDLADALDEISAAGTRVVSVAERGFGGAAVAIDNERAAFDITKHLTELGHRRIGFVRGIPGLTTAEARQAGYLAAMTSAGLQADLQYEGNFRYESGQSAALQFLARGLPDAILAANDESAIGVLMALRQAGVGIPETVSVAGIGGTRVSQLVDLTTVNVALYETGAEAARRIIDRRGWDPERRTILPHRLVIRGTTARR